MITLIERELLESGYIPEKIYKLKNITISIFDMGLTVIEKDNIKIFEGRINTLEEFRVIASSLDIPFRTGVEIYYNSNKYNLEQNDLIECFTNYGYCIISLIEFTNFQKQKYIFIKKGYCIKETGEKIEFTNLKLNYTEFEYITIDEINRRKLLSKGVKINYLKQNLVIENIINNIGLGKCQIKFKNIDTISLVAYQYIKIIK